MNVPEHALQDSCNAGHHSHHLPAALTLTMQIPHNATPECNTHLQDKQILLPRGQAAAAARPSLLR